jgi:hypothetical protein
VHSLGGNAKRADSGAFHCAKPPALRITHRKLLVAPCACKPRRVQGRCHAIQTLREFSLQVPACLPVPLLF